MGRGQREDWGQRAAEKLSFTLVNKQGWGEQRAIQQYYLLRLLIQYSSRIRNTFPPCREGLIVITAWRPPVSRELLSLLALAFTHFQEACLHRDELIPLTKQASRSHRNDDEKP